MPRRFLLGIGQLRSRSKEPEEKETWKDRFRDRGWFYGAFKPEGKRKRERFGFDGVATSRRTRPV